LSENKKISRQRLTSSKLQEKNKRIFGVSLNSIRRDIAYKPSNPNLNQNKFTEKASTRELEKQTESPNSKIM